MLSYSLCVPINRINIICLSNLTIQIKRNLLPPILNTMRVALRILTVLNLALISALFCQFAIWTVLYQDNKGCLAEECFSQNSRNVLFAIVLINKQYHAPILGATNNSIFINYFFKIDTVILNTQRLGNGQQGFPIQLIESTSFKSFSTFQKNETLAVRFTRWLGDNLLFLLFSISFFRCFRLSFL